MRGTRIDAIELVRRIRDHHAELLRGKSPTEVRAFFQREAAAANAEAERLLQDRLVRPEQAGDEPQHEARQTH